MFSVFSADYLDSLYMAEELSIYQDWIAKKTFPDELDSTQLWLIHIPSFSLDRIAGVLAEAELEKASAFRFFKDEKTYKVCRGFLRLLLGKYLNSAPNSIEFIQNAYGKPELSDFSNGSLFFNVSHSGDFGLVALNKESPIGVDLEFIREIDYLNLADSVFSNFEKTELLGIPTGLLADAFYSGWTRKESFIKAIGKGLSFPLKEFYISLNPQKSESDVEMISKDSGIIKKWEVVDISFHDQYKAALAIEKEAGRFFEKFVYES